jgi:hypothetical protein
MLSRFFSNVFSSGRKAGPAGAEAQMQQIAADQRELARLALQAQQKAIEIAVAAHETARLTLEAQNKAVEIAYQQMLFHGLQSIGALLTQPALADPKRLERSGWKAYSQNDEDGILAEIFRRIGAPYRSFIEFGCGDGLENNSAYLLSQGWRGLWMDGSAEHAAGIRRMYEPLLAAGLLQFTHDFITRENINALISAAHLGPEVDLLSIDLDGNDYHVWEAIDAVNARVVVLEYNGKFRPPHHWCMAYDSGHNWQGGDLMGASLQALTHLAGKLGYQLAGCNLSGVNAFFVRRDLAGDKFTLPATAEHLFQTPRYYLGPCYRLERGHDINPRSVVQGALAASRSPGPAA